MFLGRYLKCLCRLLARHREESEGEVPECAPEEHRPPVAPAPEVIGVASAPGTPTAAPARAQPEASWCCCRRRRAQAPAEDENSLLP